ncbi:MAG TPA: LON peptidase substrate-binding domain-containing protein [Thermodesulfobacteriota bacterium]|jgi:Lon protease-like protein
MESPTFDTESLLNLDNFSGIIPLFPLPNIVFFPNSLLPLHVFEPRYRQLVEDIIDSERIIGMVLLKPGWEKNYHDKPEIFSVGCMGRIINIEVGKDGRSNIVLYGLKRVRIAEILHDAPYRLARVNLMEDIHGTNQEGHHRRIVELITRWNSMLGKEYKSHRINLDSNLALGTLTDCITPQIVSNVFHMQEFLEEATILKRADMILEQLETKLEIISITSKKRNSILEKRHLN